VGLAELEDEWTLGITMLMLRKMTKRLEATMGKAKKKDGPKPITEAELLKSDFMKG